MRIFGGLLAAVLGLAAAAPAQAAWFKAETDRFIVYGDVGQGAVQDYAVRLTAYDQILHLMNPGAKTEPPARKFEVYLVLNHYEMERVAPKLSPLVVGYYFPGTRGLYALAIASAPGMSKDETLFHEYAHHFMLENFPAPYPGWFVEGWADYFSTTRVMKSGFQVGGYDNGRVATLFNTPWLPLDTLLSKSPWQNKQPLTYYSQAWLLTHYMMDNPARAAQLDKATRAIAYGADPVKAVEEATGQSLDELTKQLRAYRTIRVRAFQGSPGPAPNLALSRIPDEEMEFRLDRLRMIRADLKTPDTRYLSDIRSRAGKQPNDGFAQLTLALAEYTYGDPAAGTAIVKARLALKPDDVDALAVGGLGNMTAADRDKDRRVEYLRTARPYLVKAYQLDKDDYRTLLAYAVSRSTEAAYPNDNDVTALLEARALAPSVGEASLLAGAALMRRGRVAEAKPILAAVANNPHDSSLARQAREILAGRSREEAAAEAAKTEADDPTAPPGAAPAAPSN